MVNGKIDTDQSMCIFFYNLLSYFIEDHIQFRRSAPV